MRILQFFLVCLLCFGALNSPALEPSSIQLEFLGKKIFPTQEKFKKTRVGGLSGLTWNPEKKVWAAISDDRGRLAEPRFYELSMELKKGNFEVQFLDVFFIHEKDQKRWKRQILDLESILFLPWANYLIGNEGDLNGKPRQPSQLMDVKQDGTWARDWDFPSDYQPEKSGKQTRGVQNNMGPEALASNDTGQLIWVGFEGPLVQDQTRKPSVSRILQLEMKEAWVLSPTKYFLYPLETLLGIEMQRGLTELLWIRDQEFFALERAAQVSSAGLGYDAKVFWIRFKGPGEVVEKKLIYDFGKQALNFEALAWGPQTAEGEKTLVVLNDNNFAPAEATEFWLFKVKGLHK